MQIWHKKLKYKLNFTQLFEFIKWNIEHKSKLNVIKIFRVRFIYIKIVEIKTNEISLISSKIIKNLSPIKSENKSP